MNEISKPMSVPVPQRSKYRARLESLKVGKAVDIAGSYAAAVNAAARYLGNGNWRCQKNPDGAQGITRIWRIK